MATDRSDRPDPVRPAGRAAAGTVQRRPAGPLGLHAIGMGELRASGNPSTSELPWPAFDANDAGDVVLPATTEVETDFAARHHHAFWAAA